MSLLRVQNLAVSSDGYAAGEGQCLERPFGHADPATMFAWAGATASWPHRTEPEQARDVVPSRSGVVHHLFWRR